MKRLFYVICLPLLSFVIGCSTSPYVDGYFYLPRPVVADIPATQPYQPPPVAAFASVVGIRNEDKQQHLPEAVEVRLRVDNNGPQTVAFDPRSMDLSTGDLFRFPPPIIESTGPVTLVPGESALVTAYFPFPGGRSYDGFDLQSLQLRWSEQIGPQPVVQVANFRQEYQRYYYHYDDPYWGIYPYPANVYVGGVFVIHRRR